MRDSLGAIPAFLLLCPVLCSPLLALQDPLPQPQEDVPVFGTTVVLPSGLKGEIYNLKPNTPKLPNFSRLKSVGVIYTNSLNIPSREFTSGFPGVTGRFEWFAIDYTGRFWIEKPDTYTFRLLSDDGSILYIDEKKVIDNDGGHVPLAVDGAAMLQGGIHTIRVSYYQGRRYHVALVLSIKSAADSGFRIFSTEDFKPPAHPEDWKFGGEKDLDKTPVKKP